MIIVSSTSESECAIPQLLQEELAQLALVTQGQLGGGLGRDSGRACPGGIFVSLLQPLPAAAEPGKRNSARSNGAFLKDQTPPRKIASSQQGENLASLVGQFIS